ncbi:hypothetical protein ACFWFU_05415 [Streptomyces sp. NPDC060235]|uniref:hypothetical protein n=1 Tax=Streptomyces sp. NPDC060235 TaxID=3347080 RepID=UPI0036471A8B
MLREMGGDALGTQVGGGVWGFAASIAAFRANAAFTPVAVLRPDRRPLAGGAQACPPTVFCSSLARAGGSAGPAPNAPAPATRTASPRPAARCVEPVMCELENDVIDISLNDDGSFPTFGWLQGHQCARRARSRPG